MKTQVLFEYPARFVGTEADDAGVLSVKGAGWFLSFLKLIPNLEVDPDLCQEDWGVVFFAKRNRNRFSVGLNAMGGADEGKWLAHVDHGVFAWIQRIKPSGKRELGRLAADLHQILSLNPSVSGIAWYTDNEAFKGFQDSGSPQPG